MAAHLQAMQRDTTHLFFTTALYYCSLLLIWRAHLQEAQREKTQLSDKLSDVLALLQALDLLALPVQKCKY